MLLSSVQSISLISFWISDQTCLFLAAAVISCFLGGILAAFVGVALTARRSVGECENGEAQNPWQTTSKGVRGKDKGRGIRHPSPSLSPFCARVRRVGECIVRMLSIHARLHLFRAGGGGGGGWFRVILEHN